jgi:hypothetical protein
VHHANDDSDRQTRTQTLSTAIENTRNNDDPGLNLAIWIQIPWNVNDVRSVGYAQLFALSRQIDNPGQVSVFCDISSPSRKEIHIVAHI